MVDYEDGRCVVVLFSDHSSPVNSFKCIVVVGEVCQA